MSRNHYSKSRKSISFSTTVDVDVDVDVNLSDFIEDIEDEDILSEYSRRGLGHDNSKFELSKISICDFFGVSHHSQNSEILKLVDELLNFPSRF